MDIVTNFRTFLEVVQCGELFGGVTKGDISDVGSDEPDRNSSNGTCGRRCSNESTRKLSA